MNGNSRFRYEFDWSAAEHSLERALELNHAYAPALHWHSSLQQTIDRIELSGESPAMTMPPGYAFAMAGKTAEAKKMPAALARLARKRHVPSFYWVDQKPWLSHF